MKCDEARGYMGMSVDGELDPLLEDRLTDHMTTCPPCREEYDRERRFKTLVTAQVHRVVAPSHLKTRIRASIGTASLPVSWRQRAGMFIDRYPRQIAGAMAAILVIAFMTAFWGKTNDTPPFMVMELVKHHLNCPIEISSDDPETLRAWFVQRDGGLGTDAPRLTASDYRLLGAHLCQMMHRNAAYMVYERGNVQISLCCVKNAPLELEGLDRVEAGRRQFYTTTYGGNHLVLWIDGDTLYAVIGPASRNDLLALAAETQRL